MKNGIPESKQLATGQINLQKSMRKTVYFLT